MKRVPFVWLVAFLIACLPGCAGIIPVGDYVRMVKTDAESWELKPIVQKNYEIGEIYRVSVGDTVIKFGNGYKHITTYQTFVPDATYDVVDGENPTHSIKLSPLQTWSAVFSTPDDDGLVIMNQEISEVLGVHVVLAGNEKWKPRGWIDVTQNRAVSMHNMSAKGMFFLTKTKQIERLTDGDFVAELVYSGISEDTIRMGYREVTDDPARPLSYQERSSVITSRLHEPMEIIFKGISLQILEARDTYLTFRVVEDGGLAWIPNSLVTVGNADADLD